MTNRIHNLTWLRTFETVSRRSSFTAAAGDLNLTQAAVSYQIRSLEQALGYKLFKRTPGNLTLTDLGRAYLPSVRQALDTISAATAGVFGHTGSGSLTVRAPISTAALWIGPRLGGFRERHPEIDIKLCSAIWTDGLPDEAFDLDIRFGSGPWPGYEAHPIADDLAAIVVPPERTDEVTHLRDLEHMPLIHILGYQGHWTRLFRELDFDPGPAVDGPKVDTTLAAIEMVGAGLGCAIVMKRLAVAAARLGRVGMPLDMDIPIDAAHYYVVPNGGGRLDPQTLLFRDWLIDDMATVR